MFSFEKLDVWKLAVEFSRDIYQITAKFPKSELFGLVSQLRRASVSISANIAEGSASRSKKEFKQFLNFALRSVSEVVSELAIAKENHYLTNSEFQSLYSKAETLTKKIASLRNSLKL